MCFKSIYLFFFLSIYLQFIGTMTRVLRLIHGRAEERPSGGAGETRALMVGNYNSHGDGNPITCCRIWGRKIIQSSTSVGGFFGGMGVVSLMETGNAKHGDL